MKNIVVIVIVFILAIPAYSATWFAGTGNDGYIDDVTGIFDALGSSPGLQDISVNNFIYENQPGSSIQNNINKLNSFVQPGDIIFWYYSGHGAFTNDQDLDETAQGSTALDRSDEVIGLSADSDLITDDNLALAFNNIALTGATIITLFDTCYAGGFIGGIHDLNSVPDLIFFGSSTELEESYAYTSEPYSIFTQGLISGLEDFNADLNNDGTIIAQEWFDFSYEYTIGRLSMQHPVFSGDGDRVITSLNPVPIPGSRLLLLSSCLVLWQVKKKIR